MPLAEVIYLAALANVDTQVVKVKVFMHQIGPGEDIGNLIFKPFAVGLTSDWFTFIDALNNATSNGCYTLAKLFSKLTEMLQSNRVGHWMPRTGID